MVERWFRDITDKRLRRGVFKNGPELIGAIQGYLDNHNQNPKIFKWTASVEQILAKVAKCKKALESLSLRALQHRGEHLAPRPPDPHLLHVDGLQLSGEGKQGRCTRR
jgi:hypothetical protein